MSTARQSAQPQVASALSRRLRTVAVLFLMAVLWMRPLISESGQRGPTPFDTQSTSVWMASNTVVLDFVLLVLIIVLQPWSSRAHHSQRLGVIGLVLLAAAAVVSSTFAHDPRSALNYSSNLMILALAGWTLGRVMPNRGLVCMLLAGVLASGAVNAVKCVLQGRTELADTFTFWETQQKPQLLAAGAAPDSPDIVNYERRMRSQNAFGYQFHPNVVASLMSSAAVLALGVLVACVRVRLLSRIERVTWAAALLGYLLLCAAAIHYTGSNGAIVAAVLGLCTVAALRIAHPILKSRPRAVWGALLAGYALLAAAIVGFGITKGTLPGASLAFRWEYWTTAMKVYGDAPLTGVGGRNFAAGYLLHKSPAATEDIENPHSVWVSLLVELGPLGLAAGVCLCAAAVWKPVAGYQRTEAAALSSNGTRFLPLIAIAAFMILHAVWTDLPLTAPGVAGVWAIEILAVWVAVFWSGTGLLTRITSDSAGVALLCVSIAGAMAMLLTHALVDFALLTPAGISTFTALTAAAAGLARCGDNAAAGASARRMMAAGSLGGAALLAHAFMVLVPSVNAARMNQHIEQSAALAAQQSGVRPMMIDLDRVGGADRLDPGPLTLLADAQFQVARVLQSRAPQSARELLRLALLAAQKSDQRFPHKLATRRILAEIAEALETTGLTGETVFSGAPDSRAAWEDAVALNPTNPRLQIRAALAWLREHDNPEAAKAARAHFERALEIDGLRSPDSPIRLQARELEQVNQGLRALRP